MVITICANLRKITTSRNVGNGGKVLLPGELDQIWYPPSPQGKTCTKLMTLYFIPSRVKSSLGVCVHFTSRGKLTIFHSKCKNVTIYRCFWGTHRKSSCSASWFTCPWCRHEACRAHEGKDKDYSFYSCIGSIESYCLHDIRYIEKFDDWGILYWT